VQHGVLCVLLPLSEQREASSRNDLPKNHQEVGTAVGFLATPNSRQLPRRALSRRDVQVL